jgi:hypothetical protein
LSGGEETPQLKFKCVTEEEIRLAFDFITEGESAITTEMLAQKLRDLKIHNYRELMGEKNKKNSLSFEELKDFLLSKSHFVADNPDAIALRVIPIIIIIIIISNWIHTTRDTLISIQIPFLLLRIIIIIIT